MVLVRLRCLKDKKMDLTQKINMKKPWGNGRVSYKSKEINYDLVDYIMTGITSSVSSNLEHNEKNLPSLEVGLHLGIWNLIKTYWVLFGYKSIDEFIERLKEIIHSD